MLGDYAYQVACAWLVLSVSGSAVTLPAVMICNAVPNGLLILAGGAVTDRWSPKRLMFCSHAARGLLVLGLCLLTVTSSVYLAVLRDGRGLRPGQCVLLARQRQHRAAGRRTGP